MTRSAATSHRRFGLAHEPRPIGGRAANLLRAVDRWGSLNAAAVRTTGPGWLLARRGLVTRTPSGSISITAYGRCVAEWMGAQRGD